ncbi:MAG: hypothetical protein H7833_10030 [Magnetococcus sp. DMHC-1]
MEKTVLSSLSPHESIQVFGTGAVKITAGEHISVVKTSLLPLPGLTGTVKAGAFGLSLVGPAFGLAGVVLAIAWLSRLAIRHAERDATRTCSLPPEPVPSP